MNRIIKLIAILATLVMCTSAQEVLTQEEIEVQRSKLAGWESKVDQAENMPPEKAIPLLGSCIRATGRESNFQIDEKWDLHRKASDLLAAIPGHARFYEEEITRVRENQIAERNRQPHPHESEYEANYELARRTSLETLGFIRSPESVQVLGEYLSYKELADLRISANAGIHHPENRVFAAMALSNLIEQPPVQNQSYAYGPEDADTWELWYAQVAAGNRTFRFKGDPQEYSLQGPVSKAIEPMAARPRQSDAPAAGPEATGPPQGWPLMTIGVLVASCSLLGGAIWTVLRQKSRTADG